MSRPMVLFLVSMCIACALGACNSDPARNNSGPAAGGIDPTEIEPPEPFSAADREYFIEARRIWRDGTDTAWAEKKAEILETKGRKGAEFLIALLAIGEQIGPTEDGMEYAIRELAHIVRYWAQQIEKDDWPVRWFVIQFFVNPNSGATFHSTVWLPVCQLVGPPIYPYVKSLLAHPDLKDLWRLEVYQGMGGCGGAIAVPDLASIVRANGGDDGQPTRVACMQGLGLTYAVEAIEPLKEGLGDPDEKVREMALDGLLEIASLKKTETIAPLCSILIPELRRAQKVKTKRLIVEALRSLTGVADLPDTAAAWEEWWRSNGGKIE